MKPNAIWVTAFALGSMAIFFGRGLYWQIQYSKLDDSTATVSQPLSLPECSGCNFILISADTLRADLFDYSPLSSTPNLAAFAKRSVVFPRAFTNAFYTTPSHMTVFTSLYPNRHRVTGSDVHISGFARTATETPALDSRFKTLAEVLQASGYSTYWFGPLGLKHLALDLGFGRGFSQLEPPLFQRPGRGDPSAIRFDSERFHQALPKAKKPFFFFLHSYITHLPYFFSSETLEFKGVFDPKKLLTSFIETPETKELPPYNVKDPRQADTSLHHLGQYQLHLLEVIWEQGDTSQRENLKLALHNAYAESVRVFDRQLGELWANLEKSGLDKNTVVILFSDHGEELFDHEGVGHSSFIEATTRVPLMIYHPKLSTGATDLGIASLIDVLPTALSILKLPPLAQAQGFNLTQVRPKYVYGFALGSSFISDGEWKLVKNGDGIEEFFNLRLDPLQKEPLTQRWPRISDAKKRLLDARQLWEMEQPL